MIAISFFNILIIYSSIVNKIDYLLWVKDKTIKLALSNAKVFNGIFCYTELFYA